MTNAATGLRAKVRPFFSSPWAMFTLALALRLVVMGFAYTIQLDPSRDHWVFGWETGRVARSIATGHGFSSPYPEPTGPTALIPPVYTYLVAGVFKLFGVYSVSSALAILTLNNLFSSLTCVPVFLIARRVFGVPAAVWAGWIWAFFPYSIALSNVVVWETSLTTLLLTLLVLLTLKLEHSKSLSAWVGYGLLWGASGLTSPAVLTTLPFLGAWIWFRQWRRGSNCTGLAIAASLAFLLVVAPWIWRCSRTYGRLVAFRGNFGLEVLVGNSSDTSHAANWNVLPGFNKSELEELQRDGEPAYMAEKQREANEFIAHHRLRYAGLTLRRVLNTWTGLWEFPPPWNMDESGVPNILMYSFISCLAFAGLVLAIRHGREEAIPLAFLPMFLPAIYYLTHSDMGFRHPIDPELAIFMAYAIVSIGAGKQQQNPQLHPVPG
ncbi:MAG TPA: glycosyltransferase family 39 protein [Candidatus Acidoferrum sp.]